MFWGPGGTSRTLRSADDKKKMHVEGGTSFSVPRVTPRQPGKTANRAANGRSVGRFRDPELEYKAPECAGAPVDRDVQHELLARGVQRAALALELQRHVQEVREARREELVLDRQGLAPRHVLLVRHQHLRVFESVRGRSQGGF